MFHLIRNATVFAPQPLGLCNILIAAGKIAYVGSDVPSLDHCLDVSENDVKGCLVVPGFIDAHTHINGGGGESGPSSRVPPVALSRVTMAGVTSVVGVLGTDDLTRTIQSQITQVYGLREEGISAWCHTGGYHVPLTTLTGNARSDIVFIEPIIGVGELALSDHRSSQPTYDEFLRIASDAYVAGLMTGKAGIVHIHMGDGPKGLSMVRKALETSEIPSRTFNPTHVNRNKELFEEALELVGLGVTIDITAYPTDEEDKKGLSATEAFLRYREGGYPAGQFTFSSDGGGCLPIFNEQGEMLHMGVGDSSSLSHTLKLLLDMGIPAEDALRPLTKNVASLLRLHSKGQIAKGCDADLVILDNLNNVSDVMAMGKWHVRGGDAIIKGTFENLYT